MQRSYGRMAGSVLILQTHMFSLTAALVFVFSGSPIVAPPCEDIPRALVVAHDDPLEWDAIGQESERLEQDEDPESHGSGNRVSATFRGTGDPLGSRAGCENEAPAVRRAFLEAQASRGPPARI